jgi:hypothetical protein
MGYEKYAGAIEEAIAGLITRFGQSPDLCLAESDLHAALYQRLLQQEILAACHATRDGRRTGLVHHDYAACLAFADGNLPDAATNALPPPTRYDLAVLNPGFLRVQPWRVVANARGEAARALNALPADERPTPLLAAVNLALLEGCSAPALAALESRFYALVRSEPDAEKAYLVVLFRHWELDGSRQRLLDALETWACNNTRIALVFVQSYADDVGRVYGGRYFNLWSRTAPLLPLDAPKPAWPRLERPRLAEQAHW